MGSGLPVYVVTTDNSVGEERMRRLNRYVNGRKLHSVSTPFVFFDRGPVDTAIQKFLNGQYGCSRSHLKAWQLFLSSNQGLALILEDDAVVPNFDDLEREVQRIGQLRIAGPLLVQMGWLELGRVGLARGLAAVWHSLRFRGPRARGYVRGFSYGTHCYVVNRSMARYLVQIVGGVPEYQVSFKDGSTDLEQVSNPCLMPLDKFVMTTLRTQAFDDCVVVRSLHNYGFQEGLDSNITNTTNSRLKTSSGAGRHFKDRLRVMIMALAEAQGERTTLACIGESVAASR